MTKEEFLQRMKERQSKISERLDPRTYLLTCVEVMFDIGAEALADLHKPQPDTAPEPEDA
jgi:uncharacterized protein YutE (UPF0331/DUF86 family)